MRIESEKNQIVAHIGDYDSPLEKLVVDKLATPEKPSIYDINTSPTGKAVSFPDRGMGPELDYPTTKVEWHFKDPAVAKRVISGMMDTDGGWRLQGDISQYYDPKRPNVVAFPEGTKYRMFRHPLNASFSAMLIQDALTVSGEHSTDRAFYEAARKADTPHTADALFASRTANPHDTTKRIPQKDIVAFLRAVGLDPQRAVAAYKSNQKDFGGMTWVDLEYQNQQGVKATMINVDLMKGTMQIHFSGPPEQRQERIADLVRHISIKDAKISVYKEGEQLIVTGLRKKGPRQWVNGFAGQEKICTEDTLNAKKCAAQILDVAALRSVLSRNTETTLNRALERTAAADNRLVQVC